MKCPNCGSSAQVRLVWENENMLTRHHYKEFKCGCGCQFTIMITYELVDIKIMENDEV